MFTISHPAPDRVDILLTGPVDAEMMAAGLDDLMAASEDISDGRMLFRITEFAMPTAGALAVELGRLPQLFRLVGRFRRCAVLSDESWLRTAAEGEGAVIPGLAIKSFALHQGEMAENWLAET